MSKKESKKNSKKNIPDLNNKDNPNIPKKETITKPLFFENENNKKSRKEETPPHQNEQKQDIKQLNVEDIEGKMEEYINDVNNKNSSQKQNNRKKSENKKEENKSLKNILPYFEKQISYKKRDAKSKEKEILLYEKKTDSLINIYNFTQDYLNIIIQIFKKICRPFYFRLSVTYQNDVKPYFKYFKDLVSIFTTFSESLKALGHSIKHTENDKNNGVEELMNVEFDLNSAVEKLNLIYSDIFNIISTNLKENIMNKPLYSKCDLVEPKFVENLNKMEKFLEKLEKRKNKLIAKYKKEFEPVFLYFKEKIKDKDPNLYNDLVCMKDFLMIEYELVYYCNKAFVKIDIFLKEMESLFSSSTNLFCDYLETLKTMIKIYYDENRFLINPEILSKNMVSNLEKLINQNIRKSIEKKFCIKNIIAFSKNEKLINEMNHILLDYRDLLQQNGINIVKNKENIIDQITNFNLQNFKSTKSFFEFLQNLVPNILKFEFQDYIQMKIDVKRDTGIIKRWKKGSMVVTQQGHIIFLDEKGSSEKKTEEKKIEEKKIEEKKIEELKTEEKKTEEKEIEEKNEEKKDESNNINEEEKNKKNGKREYVVKDELSDGIMPNKIVYMYLKTCYGIYCFEKKDDKKFIFQIWTDALNDKKIRHLNIDALSQESLNQVINILNDNNQMNLTPINK